MRALKWGLGWTALMVSAMAWVKTDERLWRDGAIPLYLLLGNTPTGDGFTRNSTVEMALQEWNAHMARVYFVAVPHGWGPENPPPVPQAGDGLSFVFMSQSVYGRDFGEDVIAVTLSRFDDGYRVESDVLFNANRPWDSYRGNWRFNRVEIRRVALHELGHVLGLGHPNEAVPPQGVQAIMHSRADDREHLSLDDKDGIGVLYGWGPAYQGAPPVISRQPVDTTVEWGDAVAMTVDSDESKERWITYQWFKDDEPIEGATSPEYWINPARLPHSGSYFVELSTSVGTTRSRIAQVTVLLPPPPTISTVSSLVQYVRAGDWASIDVGVTGKGPFTYQWYKNGAVLAGADSHFSPFGLVRAVDDGEYHVVISNAGGPAVSEVFHLIVLPPKADFSITLNPNYRISGEVSSISVSGDLNGFDYRWYRDGRLLPNASSEWNSPEGLSPGEYFLVANDRYNWFVSDTLQVGPGNPWPLPPPPKAQVAGRGGVVYAIAPGRPRLQRYDLTNGLWLPEKELPGAPTALLVDEAGVYVAMGHQVVCYTLDLEPLATSLWDIDVQSLAVRQGVLYGNGLLPENGNLQLESRRMADGVKVASRPLEAYLTRQIALGGEHPRLFLSGRPVALALEEGGGFGAMQFPNLWRDQFPGSFNVFVSPDGRYVVDDRGGIVKSDDLEPAGHLGRAFNDLSFASAERLLILRGEKLHLYGGLGWTELGEIILPQAGECVLADEDHAYVFARSAAGGVELRNRLPWSDFQLPAAAPRIDPEEPYLVESAFLSKDGTVFLYNKVQRQLHRWSVRERRYLASVPLQGSPRVFPAEELDRVFLVYPEPHALSSRGDSRITVLSLNDDQFEEKGFFHGAGVFSGMGATDRHVIFGGGRMMQGGASREGYEVFSLQGEWIDWQAPGSPARDYIWNAARRRLYAFLQSASTGSPRGVISTEVREDGTLGSSQQANLGSRIASPLRVHPSGDSVLLGDGSLLDGATLARVGSLPSLLDDAAWVGPDLYTVLNHFGYFEVKRWNAAREVTASLGLPGRLVRMFPWQDDQLVLVTSNYHGQVGFTVLDSALGEVSRDLLPLPTYLANLSSRLWADGGGQAGTAGFVIEGEEKKRVLIRAVGPSLQKYGVNQFMANPELRLRRFPEQAFQYNDDWQSVDRWEDLAEDAARAGAFPLEAGSRDAAWIGSLEPGIYTVEVGGANGSAGVVLVELYDLDSHLIRNRLANISTRARVGTGEATLVAGWVVGGDTSKRYLIRGVGPTLESDFGVGGVLRNPRLIVRTPAGEVVRENDDWEQQPDPGEVAAVAQQVGAFPLRAGSADAAVLVTLAPGIYTAEVLGVNDTEGEALVEVYEVP